jgi:hypothetical protein
LLDTKFKLDKSNYLIMSIKYAMQS